MEKNKLNRMFVGYTTDAYNRLGKKKATISDITMMNKVEYDEIKLNRIFDILKENGCNAVYHNDRYGNIIIDIMTDNEFDNILRAMEVNREEYDSIEDKDANTLYVVK